MRENEGQQNIEDRGMHATLLKSSIFDQKTSAHERLLEFKETMCLTMSFPPCSFLLNHDCQSSSSISS